jgi:2-iminoacetate synthase
MEREMRSRAGAGLKEILILTGESREVSGPDYIGGAIELAKKYFSTIGLETYPVNVDEYRYFRECGADFVSVYQETYDIGCYGRVHPSGAKRSFPYRFHAQERAILGGMRGVAFGALLGLGDFRRDSYAAGIHAFLLQKKYPHAEISFSFPRLRPHISGGREGSGAGEGGYGSIGGYGGANKEDYALNDVDADKVANVEGGIGEKHLLQTMLAYRLFMPYAGITISTRERPGFRDHVIGMAATKISAGVKVGVGGHSIEAKGDEQFSISDPRSVDEIRSMIVRRGMQPVFTDYIRV